MIDTVDKLVEDIVEVTEILMCADEVDIEAFAHPDTKPTLHKRIQGGQDKWGGWCKSQVGQGQGGRVQREDGGGGFQEWRLLGL